MELGPAAPALPPAVFVAVPAAIENLNVPTPLNDDSVTRQDVVVHPETPIVALAFPVLLGVIFPAVRVTDVA